MKAPAKNKLIAYLWDSPLWLLIAMIVLLLITLAIN
jgi:hypothetical protein